MILLRFGFIGALSNNTVTPAKPPTRPTRPGGGGHKEGNLSTLCSINKYNDAQLGICILLVVECEWLKCRPPPPLQEQNIQERHTTGNSQRREDNGGNCLFLLTTRQVSDFAQKKKLEILETLWTLRGLNIVVAY